MPTKSQIPFQLKLVHDYQFDEVASAIQKSIRRNQEYEACFWVFIMHESGYFNYVWKRLLIIASEDVGNATPEAAILVHSLQQNYKTAISSVNRKKNDALQFLMQATMFLCRAKKSREADSITNLIRANYELNNLLEVPDYAVDVHTARGREVYGKWGTGTDEDEKRRLNGWYDIWSKVSPDTGDRYVDKLRSLKGVPKVDQHE